MKNKKIKYLNKNEPHFHTMYLWNIFCSIFGTYCCWPVVKLRRY